MWPQFDFSTILSNASKGLEVALALTGLGAGIFGPKDLEKTPQKKIENQAQQLNDDAEAERLIRLFHNGKSLDDTSEKDKETMRTLIVQDITALQNQTELRIDDYLKDRYKYENPAYKPKFKSVIENFLDANNSQPSSSIDIFSIESRENVVLYKDYLETELEKMKEPKKTSPTPPPPQIKTQTRNAGGPRARPSSRRSGDTLVPPPLLTHNRHFSGLSQYELSHPALTGLGARYQVLGTMRGTTPKDTPYDRQMEFKKLKDLGEFAADLKMKIDELNNKIQNQHIAEHNRKDYTAQVRVLQSRFNKIFDAHPGGNRSKEKREKSIIDEAYYKRLKEAKPTATVQIKGAGPLDGSHPKGSSL